MKSLGRSDQRVMRLWLEGLESNKDKLASKTYLYECEESDNKTSNKNKKKYMLRKGNLRRIIGKVERTEGCLNT